MSPKANLTTVDSGFQQEPLPNQPFTVTPFRLRFDTPTVAPKGLPPFPYQSSKLSFSAITYTAIVWAEELRIAVALVEAFWPEATLTEAEEGVSGFKDTDNHLSSVQYGVTKAPARSARGLFNWRGR